MAQIATVTTKFRETLLFCLHGLIALIYTLTPPPAAPPCPITAPWWTISVPQLLHVQLALQGRKFREKELEFSFTRFSFPRFVARRAGGRVIV